MAAASAGSVNRCSSVSRRAPWLLCDVAEDPAGADGGELLIITDQPDAATTADDELNGGVQGEGVGHPGFVDDHQAGPADAFRPVRQVMWWMDQVSLASVSAGAPVCVAEWAAAAADGASPTTWPPLSGPCLSEGAHGGGFPGAGGRDRELKPRPGGAHRTNQIGLTSVEGDPVRG